MILFNLIDKERKVKSVLKVYFFFFCFLFFLGPHLQLMEVSWLGVQSDLQLPAYTRATAMRDLSCICDLHHSSWQCWIHNPLSEARDQTCNLIVPSRNCAGQELQDESSDASFLIVILPSTVFFQMKRFPFYILIILDVFMNITLI